MSQYYITIFSVHSQKAWLWTEKNRYIILSREEVLGTPILLTSFHIKHTVSKRLKASGSREAYISVYTGHRMDLDPSSDAIRETSQIEYHI